MTQTSTFLIEHQCPQCGAPATLEETDHLFNCGFCRVKSYLLPQDFFRYMLPSNAPRDKTLTYLPYWRYKGCLFSSVPGGVRQKIVDVSYQGVASTLFPVSLGLRSQTQKLRFVTPETEGRFLKPTVSHQQVLEIVEKRFSVPLPKPIFAQSFIGESLSQIYSPFYFAGKVFDAILNRPISQGLPADFDESTLQDEKPEWPIRFVPTLCPNCGWDMEGQRDSLAMNCRNCNSVWLATPKGFTKLPYGHMSSKEDNLAYLPFYRIRAAVSGITLDSYADLIKVANLPKVPIEEWKERAFRFWFPAFKIRPQELLRFSRNLTLAQPEDDWVSTLPEAGSTHAVTLSIQEALEGLKIDLASFMKPPSLLPRLLDIEIKPKAFMLIYIPFRQKGMELSQPTYRLRVNKNLLAYARNL